MPCTQIICGGGKETESSPYVDQNTHMPALPTIHHKLPIILIIDVIKSLQKGPLCMITRMSVQNVCSCYCITVHCVWIDFKMHTW